MRTFLGLCFSVGMTRRVAEAMEREAARLAETGAKLAWVEPAMMHVTLKYFGEIPEEALDAIAARLRTRAAELPPIGLQAKGYGRFPSDGAPHVLWIGIHGGKPLEALHKAVEADMVDLGFAREARPYHPHLTVARVAEGESAFEWPPSGSGADVDFGIEKIGEIVVFESKTSAKSGASKSTNRGGVTYLARARVPFLNNAAKQ
jgi:2'-5' RNA ligase